MLNLLYDASSFPPVISAGIPALRPHFMPHHFQPRARLAVKHIKDSFFILYFFGLQQQQQQQKEVKVNEFHEIFLNEKDKEK